jgi:hypothetical protein
MSRSLPNYDVTLEEFLENIPEDISPEDISICFRIDYGGGTSITAEWQEEESEDQFRRRLSRYKYSLDRYNAWYSKNEEKIKEELRLRALEEEDKERKRQERQLKSKEKERKRLEKEIKRLKKQVANL